MADKQWELFARCASGFEQALAQELKELGLRQVRPLQGGVAFFGAVQDAYVACLWSCVATRVQLVLARVGARDADQLYHGVASFPWEQHVRDGATIAVSAHGQNASLRNTKFTALKVKDALCDRLRNKRGTRPNVDAKDPDVQVDVALHQQKATLYLNLSGASLHRRGYRKDGVQSEAPLKETLAAGILRVAGWPAIACADGALVDPMCGSGTLAIEAALQAAHAAPGLARERWGFMGWLGHNEDRWQKTLAQAREQRLPDPTHPRILAGDLDPTVVNLAREHAKRAGIDAWIRFFVDDAKNLRRHLRSLDHARKTGVTWETAGLLVCNPPYGRRLLSGVDLHDTYDALRQAIEALPTSWSATIITPDTGIDSALGRTPKHALACFNGPIAAWVRVFDLHEHAQTLSVTSLAGIVHDVWVAEPASQQFAARLRKVAKERARWARRDHTTCYRIYDADLPEYAFSLDLYQGSAESAEQRFACLHERRRPKAVDAQRAAHRLADAQAIVAATLEMPVSHVLVTSSQDARTDIARKRSGTPSEVSAPVLRVREDDVLVETDLTRPESSLPLSLREVRRYVRRLSPDKHVATLFCDAGLAAQPQAGGAREVVHATGDVLIWLDREAQAHRRYDLVVCEPPEWLPAPPRAVKGRTGRDWDLKRDASALFQGLAGILSSEGIVVLVWQDPSVTLNQDAIRAAGLVGEDVSASMVCHDFERSRDLPRIVILRSRH